MARRPAPPVFVPRQNYRQRRLRDAIRVLPALGLVLWLLPLAWAPGSVGNGAALIHIFAVWAALVAAALAVSLRLRPGAGDRAEDASDPDGPT